MAEFATIIRLSSVVAWRHWQIFRRDLLANISPTLVDPFLYVMVFGYWLGGQVAHGGNRSYLQFMAPGITAMSALFTAFFEGSYGFYVRLELEHVFKALLTTPVGPREILLGELIWLAAKGAIMSSVVSLVLLALGIVHLDFIFLIPVMGAMTAVAAGTIGLVSSCYVRNINQFQAVYGWIISPMFFMSGMFVPTEVMPKMIQYLCWVSPFFHSVKLAQATLWPEDVAKTWLVHGGCLVLITALLVYWASRRILLRLQT